MELVDRHKIAKGDSIINTSTKIYLNAKLIIKANDEIESIPLRIPSREKISKEFETELFKSEISVSKDMSFPKIFFPNSQKNELIRLVAEIKNLQIDNE